MLVRSNDMMCSGTHTQERLPHPHAHVHGIHASAQNLGPSLVRTAARNGGRAQHSLCPHLEGTGASRIQGFSDVPLALASLSSQREPPLPDDAHAHAHPCQNEERGAPECATRSVGGSEELYALDRSVLRKSIDVPTSGHVGTQQAPQHQVVSASFP